MNLLDIEINLGYKTDDNYGSNYPICLDLGRLGFPLIQTQF